MDFLQRIDWRDHDGVNLAMLDDAVRNHFYECIIRETVRDKVCLDIGFGTGLLSIMALHHGAKHVIAFESDPDRYELGKIVISRLGLDDKIILFNERYQRTRINDYSNIDVILHETLGFNLWQEGFWNSLGNWVLTYLPNNYRAEIHAIPVSERLAKGLLHTQQDLLFDPGVDVPDLYVDYINQLIGESLNITHEQKPSLELKNGYTEIPTRSATNYGWHTHLRLINTATCVAGYEIDANRQRVLIWDSSGQREDNLDLSINHINLEIKLDHARSNTWLLVPRVSVKHNDHVLNLERGHWGPSRPAVICHNRQDPVVISHSVIDGTFLYLE